MSGFRPQEDGQALSRGGGTGPYSEGKDMLDLEDMTASKLRASLEGDDEDSYSERFGKNT